MQFKALTVLALSALAIASPELKKRQDASTTQNPIEFSVLSVLATALPPSLGAIASTNIPEVVAIVASSFSAGQIPEWYSALPSDVKSYLPILLSEIATTAPITAPSISATISSSLNTTTISSVHSASLKATTTATGSVAGSESSAGASSTSSGGASYPSAVVGAGVAGALGLLGMLAL